MLPLVVNKRKSQSKQSKEQSLY